MKNVTKKDLNARYDAALLEVGPILLVALEPLACYDEGPIDDDVEDDVPMYEDSEFPTVGQVRAARAALKKFEWLLNQNGESK